MACYNSFSEYSRDKMIDALPSDVWVSLHSADPEYNGNNEIDFDGRKEVSLQAASNGERQADPDEVDFEVEADQTVAYVGLWDAEEDGNFLAQIEIDEFTPSVQAPFRVSSLKVTANLGLDDE